MLTVNTERWHQTAENLTEQALSGEHHRTRERFLAIYEVTKGKSATQVGLMTKRNPQTVMEWVHCYNEWGSEAMVYQAQVQLNPKNSI